MITIIFDCRNAFFYWRTLLCTVQLYEISIVFHGSKLGLGRRWGNQTNNKSGGYSAAIRRSLRLLSLSAWRAFLKLTRRRNSHRPCKINKLRSNSKYRSRPRHPASNFPPPRAPANRSCRKSSSARRRQNRSPLPSPGHSLRRRQIRPRPRKQSWTPRCRSSIRRATRICCRKSALRLTPSAATRSRNCRKSTTRRSTRSSCRCRACPTIRRSPIPNFHVRNEYANVQTRINGVVRPRGRFRSRAVPRHQFHRQHVASDRRAAGRIRSAHRRRARHHQPKLSLRRAARSASMAAAGRRSRRASTTAAASAIRSILSRRAAIGTISASKIRRRRSTPFTTRPSKASSSAMPRRCSTSRRGSA